MRFEQNFSTEQFGKKFITSEVFIEKKFLNVALKKRSRC